MLMNLQSLVTLQFYKTFISRHGKKINTLKLLAVFSAIAWNFSVKVYTFM